MGISVVVPTAGRTTRLLLTLESLLLERESTDLEIVVVDDAGARSRLDAVLDDLSDPGSLTIVATGGRGAATARNVGARASRHPLVLFVDDDTLLRRGTAAAHVAAHSSGGDRVVHGAVTDLTAFMFEADAGVPRDRLEGLRGRTLSVSDLLSLADHARTLLPRQSRIERIAASIAAMKSRAGVSWLLCIGTNTSLPVGLFESVGGFDAQYDRQWGGEDLEMGLRLSWEGAQFAYLPEAVAYHLTTARRDADDNVRAFWDRAAHVHQVAGLSAVGEMLSGRTSFENFARADETGVHEPRV